MLKRNKRIDNIVTEKSHVVINHFPIKLLFEAIARNSSRLRDTANIEDFSHGSLLITVIDERRYNESTRNNRVFQFYDTIISCVKQSTWNLIKPKSEQRSEECKHRQSAACETIA